MIDLDNYPYKIGISSIDEQHYKWLEMMKQLTDYKSAANKESLVLKILEDLCAYTDTHFAFEESLFKKYDYPDAEKHIQSHHSFYKKLNDLNREVQNNMVPVCTTVLAPMKAWLVEHISCEDKKYVEFLLSKGLK